jgi:hypothetical protein
MHTINGLAGVVSVRDVLLGYLAECPDGSSGPMFIPLPDADLSVSNDAQVWAPPDQQSFQGVAAAPDVCHGQAYQAPAELLQARDLFSEAGVDVVRIRVHLVDATTNPSLANVPWSAEQPAIVNSTAPTPTPFPTATATPSPTATAATVTVPTVDISAAVPTNAVPVAAVPTINVPMPAIPTIDVPTVTVPTITIANAPVRPG